jgi:hypothetical protein
MYSLGADGGTVLFRAAPRAARNSSRETPRPMCATVGHHRHTKQVGQRPRLTYRPFAARLVDAVEGDHQRFAEQTEFERQFEVALQRCRVDHLDQDIGDGRPPPAARLRARPPAANGRPRGDT